MINIVAENSRNINIQVSIRTLGHFPLGLIVNINKSDCKYYLNVTRVLYK